MTPPASPPHFPLWNPRGPDPGTAWTRFLDIAVDLAVSLFSEPQCAACDAPIARANAFCPPCAATLTACAPISLDPTLVFAPSEVGHSSPAVGPSFFPPGGPSFSPPVGPGARAPPRLPRVAALGAYGGALADAIRRFKYGDRPDLARPLGRLLAGALRDREDLPAPDRLVPVPLHPRRLAARRYNQAALLAPFAAPGIPMDTRALRRCRDTSPQADLDLPGRRDNVAGAFVADPSRVVGRAIWLIDDVTTTGATLGACAGALHRAGAVRVDAVVLAAPLC